MNQDANNNLTPVKITDVAKLADVSITTVSRALNGGDKVNKKTLKRVLHAIDVLGYVPNEMARSLVTKSNKMIGVLIPDIFNGYYAELITYIEPILSASGYSLQLCITNSEGEKLEYYLEDLLRRRAAGVIVLSSVIQSQDLIRKANHNMALVAIEGEMPGVDRIGVENMEGTYLAVENLIAHGHTRIGFAGYQFQYPSLNARVCGYRKAHEARDLPVDEALIIDEAGSKRPGYDAALKLLSLPQRPTAIQCMNEYCAQGVYLALMEHGLRIPEDISVSAFDGQAGMRVLSPRLTTASTPIREIATAAVELVLQKIGNSSDTASRSITFPITLIHGESVKNLSAE